MFAHSTLPPTPRPARIGLMAGWGRYPFLVVEALRRQGSQVYCLGVVGHADPKLAEICQDFQWSGLGRFGAAIRYFKRHAVSDVIMAGKIHKVVLFKPWMIVRNTPDLRTIRMFIPHFLTHKKDNKDDTLLGAIVEEFAREGMRFGRPTDYAAELLVSKGQLTRRGPSARQWKDIRFGWKLAKEMGRLGRRPERGGERPGGAGRSRPSRAPTNASAARACCAAPAGSAWSRWPSRSRTCATTCRRSACRPSRTSPRPAAACWPSRPAGPSCSTGRK